MSTNVKLYYQCNDKLPLWDFCGHAAWGARWNDVPAIPFERVDDIPESIYHIVVGSVEEASKYLTKLGLKVPQEIDVHGDIPRMWLHTDNLDDATFPYPSFIKPKGAIKAFPGTIVKSAQDAGYAIEGYTGDIWVSPIFNFLSEWRCYVRKGKILGVCFYGTGDPNMYPDRKVVQHHIDMNVEKLKGYNSFVLDFGITDTPMKPIFASETTDVQTILIEGNDAWSIGNYGLDSVEYYNFIKDRWFQLTGLI